MNKLKIVDVSAWQPNYTFGNVNEDGLIVKATESVDYTNPFLKKHIDQVINKKVPFGVYHFATTDSTPEKQAKYFYNVCKSYFKSKYCIAVLDYEISSYSESVKNSFITRFITKFNELTHGTCWVYGNTPVVSGASNSNSPLWLAFYPYASTALSPSNWELPNLPVKINYPVSMWQYTTSGDKLDRSIFFGNLEQWCKLSVKGVK